MTCIAAVIDQDKVWMGCDSFVGGRHTHMLLPQDENKLFTTEVLVVGAEKEKLIFGFAGSVRDCQVVKHDLNLPIYNPDDEMSDIKFLINRVIPAIKRAHKSHGVLTVREGVETAGSWFLLGWRKKLYYIGEDYCVVPSSTNYLALGSGEDVAHGSLQSTEGLNMHPGERIVQALKAAESNTNFVRAPFYVESI